MNNSYIKTIGRAILLTAFLLTIGLSNLYSQIGELGIYGSVPEASRDSIRYVYLTGDGWDGPDHFLPVNGLGNYNFFYLPDGTGFIPSGPYRVYYYASDKITNYGYDSITYNANSGHTNGAQVRPFNNPPATPRGVHGIVYGRINGVNYPIENALIISSPLLQQGFGVFSKTNGAGYFSIYYKNGYGAEFLPVYFGTSPPAEYYNLFIQGSVHGCFFLEGYQYDALWQPSVPDNPASPHYFVTEAEFDWGDIVMLPDSCK